MLSPSAFTAQMDALPEHQKLAGMALGSASYSSARAAGPALAGAIIAAAGTTAALWFTVALAVLGTVLLSRARRAAALPPPASAAVEAFRQALQAALRVAKDNATIRRELLGTGIFVFCASGLWALVPLVAAKGAGSYGALLGSIGAARSSALWCCRPQADAGRCAGLNWQAPWPSALVPATPPGC
jgi:hypothetical protein